MTTKVIAVFGYNNTRLYDVLRIRDLAERRLGAEVLLVKEGIDDRDLEVTPYCLDHRPEDPRIDGPLGDYLLENDLDLVGCLPFSDKGVVGAAHAARAFGLFGDDPGTARAMLDKSAFRRLEREVTMDPDLYRKPFFETVRAETRLRELLARKGSYFLKPTSEGNSRGCMKIESADDLDRWLAENPGALSMGVICEEILGLSDEYSFDGVNGSYWITKKFTTPGAYRAEYQHIVPAPMPEYGRARIHTVLAPLLRELGSRGGAFHHEFFVRADGRLASVEPNRRPAGMWIWDLAEWVFAGFDPWTTWIDRCAGRTPEPNTPVADGFAGIRGVIAKHDGTLCALDPAAVESELEREIGPGKFRFSALKTVGSAVRSVPRNNSDFLAYVAIKDADADRLCAKLELAEGIVLRHMEVVA